MNICIAGGGHIGVLAASLLAESGGYEVSLIDIAARPEKLSQKVSFEHVDIDHAATFTAFLKSHQIETVVSCLPFFCNIKVAEVCSCLSLNYFDLTEDVTVTQAIKALAQGKAEVFMPQCGLAPGFISIAANQLIQSFDQVEEVKLRVGALPQTSSHALQYALTWSVDGLINEYINDCVVIKDYKRDLAPSLTGLESLQIEGNTYEAFCTSGGLGSLADTYEDSVKEMNYKSLRYPGHCEKMKFLLNDLKLKNSRSILKEILINSVPSTKEDMVVIYVSAKGKVGEKLAEKTYVNKIYPLEIFGHTWTAIQVSTASSLCAAIDIVMNDKAHYQGFIKQEQIPLDAFIANRFGQVYEVKST